MYLWHYALRDQPFKLAHDPTFYYPTPHQEPSNQLFYSIEEHQGLATLVGQPGTGKTTLLRRLLQTFDRRIRGVLVSDNKLGGMSLLSSVAAELRFPVSDEKKLPVFLRNFLHQEVMNGKTVVLLIDEAQDLTTHQLEEVRHLTNLELPGRKLVEIILAGQPTLESRLAAGECAALQQRVAVRSYLDPLNFNRTLGYIRHRVATAGAKNGNLFTIEAIKRIYQYSNGLPRLINLICERALIVGYAEEASFVDAEEVNKAASELQTEMMLTDAPVSSRPKEGPIRSQVKYVNPNQTGAKDIVELRRSMMSRLDLIDRKLDSMVQFMQRLHPVPRVKPSERQLRPVEGTGTVGNPRITNVPALRDVDWDDWKSSG